MSSVEKTSAQKLQLVSFLHHQAEKERLEAADHLGRLHSAVHSFLSGKGAQRDILSGE